MECDKIFSCPEILDFILRENRLNATEFCRIIGKTQSFVSDIRSGKMSRISLKNSELIANKFPQYSVTWICSGRQPIYSNIYNNINSNNSVNTNSANCGNIAPADGIGNAVAELERQLKVKDEQIAKLIEIISNYTKGVK